jgi:hypothetical protein
MDGLRGACGPLDLNIILGMCFFVHMCVRTHAIGIIPGRGLIVFIRLAKESVTQENVKSPMYVNYDANCCTVIENYPEGKARKSCQWRQCLGGTFSNAKEFSFPSWMSKKEGSSISCFRMAPQLSPTPLFLLQGHSSHHLLISLSAPSAWLCAQDRCGFVPALLELTFL